jgi:hypothetical protein
MVNLQQPDLSNMISLAGILTLFIKTLMPGMFGITIPPLSKSIGS